MIGLQTKLRVPDPWDVTRIGKEAGSQLGWDAIWRDVHSLYKTGLHPAIGLCIRHRGKVVLDRTVGHVEHVPGAAPGAVTTPDTLFNLFSASKVLTATIIHALAEDGVLDLDERVAHYLPGFEAHGKQGIRLVHLMNHTAGIPNMPQGPDAFEVLARGRYPLEPLLGLKPVTRVGTTSAYHPVTSWLLLDEIVQAATGKDLRQVARQRLLEPLGFQHMNYGVSPEDVPRVAKHTYTGPPTPGFMSRIFGRTIGADLDTAIGLSNHESFLTAILPSANVVATGRETTRFLQMLLNGGEIDGTRVLEERTVRRAVTEVTRVQLDGTFGFPMRYGLGFMMGGDRFSLFGLTTKRAFGHLGFTNVVVYADPTRDLTVSFLTTGKPMLAPGTLRWYWVLQRIAMMVPRVQQRAGTSF